MNKIILALTLITGMAFAAPTSPDYCQLKVNGQVLWSGIGQDENGQGFFAFASQYSRSYNTCVHAKIDRVASSGRVYDNGKLVPSFSGKFLYKLSTILWSKPFVILSKYCPLFSS